jgi:presqualene diphosphate synthase
MPHATAQDWNQVRARVKAAGTSFYWAMRLMPPERRDGLFAVYAFCRDVDDIADGEAPADTKRAALADWRGRIAGAVAGSPEAGLAATLADTVQAFGLAQQDFHDVIDGMAMDADGPIVAPDWATLDLYCDRVASAVGRLCVPIFGAPGADGIAVARHLGRALQLTNIMRDVQEDATLGRLYLPREALAAAGIPQEPHQAATHPALAKVLADVGARAKEHYVQAETAMTKCERRAMRPARMMKEAYRPYLDRLEAAGWRLEDVQSPSKLAKTAHRLWIAAKHMVVA